MSKITKHNYEAFLLDYFDANLSEAEITQLKAFAQKHPELQIDFSAFELPRLAEDKSSFDFKNDLKKNETHLLAEGILNYLENKLSAEEKNSFENKVSSNTELAEELGRYKKTILVKDNACFFENKSHLIKTDDDFILNNVSLAYFEGQLKVQEKADFEKELQTNNVLKDEQTLFLKTKLFSDSSIVFPNKEQLKREAKIVLFFNLKVVTSLAAAILLLFGLFAVFNFYKSKPSSINFVSAEKLNPQIKKSDSMPMAPTLDFKKHLTETNLQRERVLANTHRHKNNTNATDSVLNVSHAEPVANSIAEKKLINSQVFDSVYKKNVVLENLAIVNPQNNMDTNLIDLALQNQINSIKRNYLIAEEDVDLDEMTEETSESKNKFTFWKRAVNFAKKANQLGLKSFDGEQKNKKDYLLSFNSFSVEKK